MSRTGVPLARGVIAFVLATLAAAAVAHALTAPPDRQIAEDGEVIALKPAGPSVLASPCVWAGCLAVGAAAGWAAAVWVAAPVTPRR
jgi:hypothetical protein